MSDPPTARYLRKRSGNGGSNGGKVKGDSQRQERSGSLKDGSRTRKASRRISDKKDRNQKLKIEEVCPADMLMKKHEGERVPALDHPAETEQDLKEVFIGHKLGTLQDFERMKEECGRMSDGGTVSQAFKEIIASLHMAAMNFTKHHLQLPVQEGTPWEMTPAVGQVMKEWKLFHYNNDLGAAIRSSEYHTVNAAISSATVNDTQGIGISDLTPINQHHKKFGVSKDSAHKNMPLIEVGYTVGILGTLSVEIAYLFVLIHVSLY